MPQAGRFASAVLGLDLALDGGRLRFFAGNAPLEDADEMIARLDKVIAGQEEAERLARTEGERRGRADAAAGAVLTVLRVRGIVVPDDARERILAEEDLERLKRWQERAVVASSLAEVLDEQR